jgi:hypothetical protein
MFRHLKQVFSRGLAISQYPRLLFFVSNKHMDRHGLHRTRAMQMFVTALDQLKRDAVENEFAEGLLTFVCGTDRGSEHAGKDSVTAIRGRTSINYSTITLLYFF